MKKTELTHPRIFNEKEWATGYYNRNKKSIQRMGKRLAGILKKSGFKGGKVLDAGCGFAAMPIEIVKMIPDAQITGIDLGEPLLDIGNRLVDEAGLSDRITLQKGDVQKMSFPDDNFDVVINTFLLHIVEEPVKMLNEIERVAKPGGIILITDLRRGFLANFVKKFRMSHTMEEALEVISQSDLRKGTPGKGLFWWDYFCGNTENFVEDHTEKHT